MAVNERLLGAASLLLCAACGGGGSQTYNLSGTATVNGTVSTRSLAAADAISTLISQNGASAGAIFISTAANQCNLINAHQDLKNGVALTIGLGVRGTTAVTAPTPGTYTIYQLNDVANHQGNVGNAIFLTSNAACTPTQVGATSGTVTLTRAEDSGYGGTFNIAFGATESLTGTFNTGTCSALTTSQVTCPP